VSPLRYELGFYIPEDGILHIHCRERLRSYKGVICLHLKSCGLSLRLTESLGVIKSVTPMTSNGEVHVCSLPIGSLVSQEKNETAKKF
jgi:hypothetical protein